jgi:hypothetical protein
MQISLLILPGRGQGTETAAPNCSLQQFAEDHNITNRNLLINGRTIPRNAWSTTYLAHGQEVSALEEVKGA